MHVSGRVGADVNVVFPEIFTLVTLVPTSAKVVSPVGKVGSVVSDVQPDKSRLKVPAGNPAIVVSAAPAIVNDVGRPEHPVRFSDVHVAGIVGTDVNPVSPVRLTVVSLVLVRFKPVSPVGKVGSVVSDVQPDKFRLKVPVGNPPIVVIPAPAIVNVVGNPEHPVRFSVVHVAGMVGKDVNPVSPVRLTVVSLVLFRFKVVSPGGKLASVVILVHPLKSKVVTDEVIPVSEVIFGGAPSKVTFDGIP